MNLNFRQKLAAAAVGTVVVAGSVAAFAYWTSGGTGTGTAATGTTAVVTINQTSPPIVDLGPGVAAEPLAGTFTTDEAGLREPGHAGRGQHEQCGLYRGGLHRHAANRDQCRGRDRHGVVRRIDRVQGQCDSESGCLQGRHRQHRLYLELGGQPLVVEPGASVT